jgi:ATP-dependent protease ClpP protease subunit
MQILQLLRDNAGRTNQPFNLVRNSAASEATLYIYDVIDSYWGVSAKMVIEALASVSDVSTLHLRINSPGGDVFEGRAIVEAIKRFAGKTIAHVDSLAASAATSIAIAANEVEISQGAFFMIHNASAVVWGDKTAMRDTANLLEKVEGTIIADYVSKSGQDASAITDWMDAETWFTADEAIANGFCDRLAATADKSTKNTWNLAAYSKAPQALSAPPMPPEPTDPVATGAGQTNTNKLRLATLT